MNLVLPPVESESARLSGASGWGRSLLFYRYLKFCLAILIPDIVTNQSFPIADLDDYYPLNCDNLTIAISRTTLDERVKLKAIITRAA